MAFAQVLVYVGAVSMVVLFAVLLTRQSRADVAIAPDSVGRVAWGVLAGGCVLGVLIAAIVKSPFPAAGALPAEPRASTTVQEIGTELMGPHAAALLIVGVILTVALLGAIVLAATDRSMRRDDSE